MADSSRIRNALDKSIHLGNVLSGTMALDPKGAYLIRQLGQYPAPDNTNFFIEIEIINGKIISLKSFGTTTNIDKQYNFYYAIIDNHPMYSLNSIDGLLNSDLKLDTYIEYNLFPITITAKNEEITTIPNNEIRKSFELNKTYYLEKVQLTNTNDIVANNLYVDKLKIDNFVTNTTEINVVREEENEAIISVPKLLVQAVGIQQMDIDYIDAKDIETRDIFLSNGEHAGNSARYHGWHFIANSGSDAITLKTDLDTTTE